MRYLHECVHDCLKRNESPYASHAFFTQFLNDNKPDERELGIKAGLAWGDAVDAVIVYEDLGISEGMKHGIKEHQRKGRQIIYRSIK